VLVLGDSLAAGLGVEREEAFPSVVQELAKKDGKEIEVINGGVSGDTSAGGLRRIGWLLNRPVDVLLLELGANDGLRGIAPESTASNLQGIIDAARKKYPEVLVVVAGMKMPPNLGEEYGAKFEAVFPALAKKNDAALVPFLLEGVGGVPEFNQGDRIHPNAEGHRILAGNVWVVLKNVLEEG
jgi:acyl-CoA thioesterase-1